MLKYVLALVLFSTTSVLADDYRTEPNVSEGINPAMCGEFFPSNVLDRGDRNLLTICRLNYAVIYDRDCKIPVLTFENLDATEIDGVEPRTNRFIADPSLLAMDASSLEDFHRSGYDRGHMVPAGDMREDTTSMEQSFYLSNVVPMVPSINRGVWSGIEKFARNIVARNPDPTYIITGAIASTDYRTIGDGVCVPVAFYKFVITRHNSTTFFVPNKDGAKSINYGMADILNLAEFWFVR